MIALLTSIAAWPAWVGMWALAIGIYAALKGLTLVDSFHHAPRGVRPHAEREEYFGAWPRAMGYLLFWPGMNADAFLQDSSRVAAPATAAREWLLAALRLGLGVALIYVAAPLAIERSDLLAGWLGMIGVVLILHFGLFDVLSLAWRRAGIDATPLMNHPLRSNSLADFWGHRWNRAFRDVAHRYLFRPLVRPLGAAGATFAAFLFSGVIHDMVISVPAGGGYGLPTVYFTLQAVGLLMERSAVGERLGLRRGLRGRLFCAVVALGPLGLLFHPPFVREIVLPMLRAFGAL